MHIQKVIEIFDYYPQCLVHPVSCKGVSHDILSKQLKKAYPDYFREYTRLCIRKKLVPGQAYLFTQDVLFGTKFLVTLTIKDNWQEKINPTLFKEAFSKFLEHISQNKIQSVAFPLIEEVPRNWLEEQFQKNKECCLENIYFF